jgi:hypothetical protein
VLDLYFNHAQKLVHISSSSDMFPVHFLMICEDIYMFLCSPSLLSSHSRTEYEQWQLRCSIRDAFISITYLIYHSFIHTYKKTFSCHDGDEHLAQLSVSAATNHSRRMTKITMKMQKFPQVSSAVNKIFLF